MCSQQKGKEKGGEDMVALRWAGADKEDHAGGLWPMAAAMAGQGEI